MVVEHLKIPEVYAALEKKHYSNVLGFFYKNTCNPEDAEDLTQETFMRIYRGLPKFEGRAKLDTWVYRIAVNCLINYYRMQKRNNGRNVSLASILRTDGYDHFLDFEEVVPSEERGPEDLVLSDELVDRVRAAVNALSHKKRAVIKLQALEELTYEETVAKLGVPNGTMKSRLNRAKEDLRTRLRGYVLS